MKYHNYILTVLTILSVPYLAHADKIDYVKHVRPILQKHCYSCHGVKKQKSSFRIDIKSEAFKGGDEYQTTIIPEKPEDSILLQVIRGEIEDMRMPPKGDGLDKSEIDILTNWIKEGAIWPDGVDLSKLEDKTDHWSFKPVKKPAVPQVENRAWVKNEIDHFILARLAKNNLHPAPEADRLTWLRRVYFDLIGLPPTPDQINAFINDKSKDAYERVVDQLLSSPRYGERWAQHWLDVVRYADTHGFEVNTERPNAWPYRDYVIQAFNADTPYDQFIKEQIAGDAYGKGAATGFLVTASVLLPGQIGKDAPSIRLARQDAIDEIVVNTGQSFLGLTIGCARCHDHKFDPITAKDYYAMQSFFAGVTYEDRPIMPPGAVEAREELDKQIKSIDNKLVKYIVKANSGTLRAPVNAKLNTEQFIPIKTNTVRLTILRSNQYAPCIDELEIFDRAGKNVALASKGTVPTASGSQTELNRHELRFINDGIYGNTHSWMSNTTGESWVQLDFTETHEIERILWGRDRVGQYSDRLALEYRFEAKNADGKWITIADSSDRKNYDPKNKDIPVIYRGKTAVEREEVQQLLSAKNKLEMERRKHTPQGNMVFAGKFRKPDKIHLLRRGDPELPQEQVTPSIPSLFKSPKFNNHNTNNTQSKSQSSTPTSLPEPVNTNIDTPEQLRRITIAEWIASPNNPLTARVMVNRIWQGHFGVGFVSTSNDFGRNGTKPTHPELLDWLALKFIDFDWSIKKMHKLIVLSATYRQSNRFNPGASLVDANARLLWRYPARRLGGEAIRDAILAVNGKLNLKMGGRGYNLFNQRGGLSGFKPIESFDENGLRRMIYAHKVRRETDSIFGAFDCPDGGQSTPRRPESTTPIQALNLFNSRFVLEQADAFATRIKTEVGDNPEMQIKHAFRLAIGRVPNQDEIASFKPVIQKHGLALLCRVLYNSNEFLFIP